MAVAVFKSKKDAEASLKQSVNADWPEPFQPIIDLPATENKQLPPQETDVSLA